MTVATPELKVWRLAIEDITEGRMTIVARTAQHSELPIDLAGEEYTIAVEGQESILQLVEGLEVKGVGYTDRGAMVAVAPRHVVAVLDEDHTWVVAIDPLTDLLVVTFELQRLWVDVPVDGIIAEAHVQTHTAVRVITAEDTSVPFSEAYDSTVEDAVGRRQEVTWDNGVSAVAPDGILTAFGAVFPRHIGQALPDDLDLAHSFTNI